MLLGGWVEWGPGCGDGLCVMLASCSLWAQAGTALVGREGISSPCVGGPDRGWTCGCLQEGWACQDPSGE